MDQAVCKMPSVLETKILLMKVLNNVFPWIYGECNFYSDLINYKVEVRRMKKVGWVI